MARFKRQKSLVGGLFGFQNKKRFLLSVIGFLLAVFLGVWALYRKEIEEIRFSIYQKFILTTHAYGLKLENIFIRGREKVSQDQIFQALGVPLHGPMLLVDLEATHQRLSALPWVKEATLERHWPDTLFITIEERLPFALWQHEKNLYLVDKDGVIIPEGNLSIYGTLPSITGANAPKYLPDLLEALSLFPSLKQRVVSATWIGNRRWNIHLENKITLLLPEKEVQKSLERFIKYETTHHLTTAAKKRIDLRIPQRIIVE